MGSYECNILIIEDDIDLNMGIAFRLQKEGFKTFSVETIHESKKVIKENNIDLIILDVNLPDGNGFDYCIELKNNFYNPIMFLTALDMEVDIIKGLKLGADDYITKPFSINILKEKVCTLLRRVSRVSSSPNVFMVDGFRFDLDKMIITKNSEEIVLAPTEFKLVKKLAFSKGRVFTRDELIEDIWGSGEYIEEHTLSVNINRIRSKLEGKNPKVKYIKTIYGIGYSWLGDTSE